MSKSRAASRELRQLFDEDQAERKDHPLFGTPEYNALRRRDARRRKLVRDVLDRDEALTSEDMYRAALVLQHGEAVADVRRGHELARTAADAGCIPARWLSAATLDRWLMYRGLPQKYGTQIVPDGRSHRVWDVDPQTSDEDRKRWNVPPLAEMKRRAAELSRTEPMPPMEQAPEWLKAAVSRWDDELTAGTEPD